MLDSRGEHEAFIVDSFSDFALYDSDPTFQVELLNKWIWEPYILPQAAWILILLSHLPVFGFLSSKWQTLLDLCFYPRNHLTQLRGFHSDLFSGFRNVFTVRSIQSYAVQVLNLSRSRLWKHQLLIQSKFNIPETKPFSSILDSAVMSETCVHYIQAHSFQAIF